MKYIHVRMYIYHYSTCADGHIITSDLVSFQHLDRVTRGLENGTQIINGSVVDSCTYTCR